jgi:DNA-binding IclR family transcriptional regulator
MHLRLGMPDRRRRTRGTPEMPRRGELEERVLRAYSELSGAALSCEELTLLLGVSVAASRAVTRSLERRGYLSRDVQGLYRLVA